MKPTYLFGFDIGSISINTIVMDKDGKVVEERYDYNHGKPFEKLKEILDEHELILSYPVPQIKLHTLSESSVDFIVRPWTKTRNYWEVYWDITRTVKKRFDEEKISIPYPQRDIHIKNEQIVEA